MSIKKNNISISVCFVCPKAYPLFNEAVEGVFGGAEVDLYYLATELAKDEVFDVSFIVADYGQADVETIEGVKIIKSLDFGTRFLDDAFIDFVSIVDKSTANVAQDFIPVGIVVELLLIMLQGIIPASHAFFDHPIRRFGQDIFDLLAGILHDEFMKLLFGFFL